MTARVGKFEIAPKRTLVGAGPCWAVLGRVGKICICRQSVNTASFTTWYVYYKVLPTRCHNASLLWRKTCSLSDCLSLAKLHSQHHYNPPSHLHGLFQPDAMPCNAMQNDMASYHRPNLVFTSPIPETSEYLLSLLPTKYARHRPCDPDVCPRMRPLAH